MKRFLPYLVFPLFFATSLFAQTPPLTIPEPANLSADWWNYFSPETPVEKEELMRRVDTVTKELEASPESTSLKTNLIRFVDIISEEIAPPKEVDITSEETYDIDSALEHYRDWKKLTAEFNSVKSDIEWQESLIAQERIQQSLKRADYLALADDDPARFAEGLALMSKRAAIEVQAHEVAFRKREMTGMETTLRKMKEELAIIPERLVANDEDLANWQSAKAEAETTLKETDETISSEEKAASSQKADPGITASMEARRAILRRAKASLDSGLAQLEVMKSGLAIATSKAKLAEEPDVAGIKKELSDHREWSGELSELIRETELTITRIRSSANDQLASSGGEGNQTQFARETLGIVDEIQQLQRQLAFEKDATDFLATLLQDVLDQSSGWMGKATNRTKDFGNSLVDKGFDLLRYPIFEINETPVNGLGLFRVLLILFAAWFISKFLRKALDRFGAKQKRVSKTSLYTVERLLHYVILTIGILMGLSSIGLDFTKLAIFASALGVGLGFGLQNMVSNFVAGLIVLFEKSLNVGDFVELQSGVTGEVREINMRSTLITTNDNVDMLIPNSEFVSGQVTNWTLREAFRRIRVPFGVAYGTDKELVRKAALEAADRTQWTLKTGGRRHPQVWLVGFGESSLDFELVVWLTSEAVKRPAAVQAAFLWEIETSLTQYGIEIPFPQRDLHIRSGLPGQSESS